MIAGSWTAAARLLRSRCWKTPYATPLPQFRWASRCSYFSLRCRAGVGRRNWNLLVPADIARFPLLSGSPQDITALSDIRPSPFERSLDRSSARGPAVERLKFHVTFSGAGGRARKRSSENDPAFEIGAKVVPVRLPVLVVPWADRSKFGNCRELARSQQTGDRC